MHCKVFSVGFFARAKVREIYTKLLVYFTEVKFVKIVQMEFTPPPSRLLPQSIDMPVILKRQRTQNSLPCIVFKLLFKPIFLLIVNVFLLELDALYGFLIMLMHVKIAELGNFYYAACNV